MNTIYCTYFDVGYAPRGIAMIASLRTVGEQGRVYVLCFDQAAANATRRAQLGDVVVIEPADLEVFCPRLAAVRPQRSRIEFYFTTTPIVIGYALAAEPDAEWVTYLDADLWFFDNPRTVYAEQSPGSVGIIEHGYREQDRWRTKFGTFNVGWVSFRNAPDGKACVAWWSERCLEWCFDRAENGQFADQGYLDQFQSVADGVIIVTHPGANLAPWNLATRDVACQGEAVRVDGKPLIFFHFHGLQQRGNRWYFAHARYGARTTTCIRENVYRPYIVALDRCTTALDVRSANATPRRRGIGGSVKHALVRSFAIVRKDTIRYDSG